MTTTTRARRARCEYPECPNWAMTGEARCSDHRGMPLPRDPASSWESRLTGADFTDILGDELARVVKQAAAETNVDSEIGILRVVMTKLLAEEHDPSKLATGVAKLSAAIAQLMRARRQISGEMADSLTDAVATILETMQP